MRKKAQIFHPLFLAIFPVLFLFSQNMAHLTWRQIFLSMAGTVFFTFVFWEILGLVLRNREKSAFLISLFLILFFSFGHFLNFSRSWGVRFLPKPTLLLFTSFFIGGLLFLAKTRRRLLGLTYFLNLLSLFLVFTSLLRIGFYGPKRPRQPLFEAEKKTGGVLGQRSDQPDIYYLILDGYARADVLGKYYDHDNSDFLDFLRRKGFYIAEESLANYSQTRLSLASSLNFQYLDELTEKIGEDRVDQKPLGRLIADSRAVKLLKERGYVFVNYSSACEGTDIRTADIYLAPGWSPDEFQNLLLATTPLPILFGESFYRRRLILTGFSEIAKLVENDLPTFTFVHFLSPHPPFVFGPKGEKVAEPGSMLGLDGDELVKKGGFTAQEYQEKYRDQLIFINSKLEELVEKLLRSSPPPVIILQADHGPGSMLKQNSFEETNLEERMPIFNAYYLPDEQEGNFYKTMTPVNSFRLIFNHYFGTDFELLEDRNYFSKLLRPYEFFEVTDRFVALD
jgi:hypothetical protein